MLQKVVGRGAQRPLSRLKANVPFYLRPCFSSPTPDGAASLPFGSYSTIYPATALAATVYGLARYISPGPLRPGKLRFCALITTWSGRVETPGPALMHAPQLGSITIAPTRLKISR